MRANNLRRAEHALLSSEGGQKYTAQNIVSAVKRSLNVMFTSATSHIVYFKSGEWVPNAERLNQIIQLAKLHGKLFLYPYLFIPANEHQSCDIETALTSKHHNIIPGSIDYTTRMEVRLKTTSVKRGSSIGKWHDNQPQTLKLLSRLLALTIVTGLEIEVWSK